MARKTRRWERNAKETKKKPRISEKLKSETEGITRRYLSTGEEARIEKRLLRLAGQGRTYELAKQVSMLIKMEKAGIDTGLIISSSRCPHASINRRLCVRVEEQINEQLFGLAGQGRAYELANMISSLRNTGIGIGLIIGGGLLEHVVKQRDGLGDVRDLLKEAETDSLHLAGKKKERSNKISLLIEGLHKSARLLIEGLNKEKGYNEIIKILKRAGAREN